MTGSTCGNSPNRTSARRRPPAARTPSCSLASADSMISANNLPSAPKSEVAIASTPANGPRPTTLIQMSAQISVSTPRTASKKRLIGKRSNAAATTLRAARMPSGSASKAPSKVPNSAIARVSPSVEIGPEMAARVGRDHFVDKPSELPEAGDQAAPGNVEISEGGDVDGGHRHDDRDGEPPPAPVRDEEGGVTGLDRVDVDRPGVHANRPFESSARRRYCVEMSIAITTTMIITRMALTSE